MAVFGSSMINSDKGGVEYGVLLVRICDEIEEGINDLSSLPDGEQGISALIEVLRVLCEKFPQQSCVVLDRTQIKRWQSIFNPWFESMQYSLPSQYADQLIESTKSDLEFLASIAPY